MLHTAQFGMSSSVQPFRSGDSSEHILSADLTTCMIVRLIQGSDGGQCYLTLPLSDEDLALATCGDPSKLETRTLLQLKSV